MSRGASRALQVDAEAREQPNDQYWSTELEELHEESSRLHFLDLWTRQAILYCLGNVPDDGRIVDLGCSSGYLLEDLREMLPEEQLVGLDFLFAGLRVARANLPIVPLLQGDACALPFTDESVDAIVSANLLEHVPNDEGALREMRRVLKPGSMAVLVVPANPNCYDYYDRFLHHQRRYARGELAEKAVKAGLVVRRQFHIGWMIYPAFWLVKKRNRRRFDHLVGEALIARVARDIAGTKDSRIGHLTRRLERALVHLRLAPPFGIREVVALQRPVR